MTAIAPERPKTAAAAAETASCAACRAILPVTAMEPVPTRPELLRCADEEACRKRYTPRRLSHSTRTEEQS